VARNSLRSNIRAFIPRSAAVLGPLYGEKDQQHQGKDTGNSKTNQRNSTARQKQKQKQKQRQRQRQRHPASPIHRTPRSRGKTEHSKQSDSVSLVTASTAEDHP
jgi:hypothetical protein